MFIPPGNELGGEVAEDVTQAEGGMEFAALLEEIGCWGQLQLEGAGVVAEGDEDSVPVFCCRYGDCKYR